MPRGLGRPDVEELGWENGWFWCLGLNLHVAPSSQGSGFQISLTKVSPQWEEVSYCKSVGIQGAAKLLGLC